MKAKIKKTPNEFNQEYFFGRSKEKNALAISSSQSKQIESYSQVKENYNKSLKNDDLEKCPDYWGGFSFIPYYFEFWEGHESRLNKREIFDKIDYAWEKSFLQP
jgi:pyridoxine/pyridoxamine 5'-phosphate oxidase